MAIVSICFSGAPPRVVQLSLCANAGDCCNKTQVCTAGEKSSRISPKQLSEVDLVLEVERTERDFFVLSV